MLKAKDLEQHRETAWYSPSEGDRDVITHIVTKRLPAMKAARQPIEKNRENYKKMVDAEYIQYPDGRSSSVVPLASALIELYVAEATKLETQYNCKADLDKYNTNARILSHVWKQDWRKNNRNKVMAKDEYTAWQYWYSVLWTWFETNTITQSDFVWLDDNGNPKRKKVDFKEEKIIIDNIDIRNWRIDNNHIVGIEDADDCVYEWYVPYQKFKELENNKLYTNIDKVKPQSYNRSNNYQKEYETSWPQDYIKMTWYWSIGYDAYVIIANDGVLIRNHPLMSTMDGKKALPFVVRWFGFRDNGIYHRWICEACMMFNSEINNLREMLMDNIRKSNSPVVAIGNGLTFKGWNFSFDSQILNFDWPMWDSNFRQIAWLPPNQAAFAYIDRLFKDIALFIGIDIQNLIGEPQQTAFQTEVQRESSQKRMSVWLRNRDYARERLANLHKDNLQRFFPRKDMNGNYPVVRTEWEEYNTASNKFIKSKTGDGVLEVTPEILRTEWVYIDVFTNTAATTINAIDREQRQNFLLAVPNIVQAYAAVSQLWINIDDILPLKKAITDLAEDNNIDTSGWSSDDEIQKEIDKGKEMFQNLRLWAVPQVQQPQQLQQPQQSQLQPNLTAWA